MMDAQMNDIALIEVAEPPAKAAKKNDPSLQTFLRAATPEERETYDAMKGPGSFKAKKEYRDLILSQKLTNLKAGQINKNTLTTSDTQVGTYRNFWMLAEKEGGLMDREFGIKVAKNIAGKCEKAGPPAIMYDSAAGVVKYLHCETGKSDIQTRTRQSILSADADMDPEAIRMATQQANAEGLSADIPKCALGNIPGEASAAKTANDMPASKDTTDIEAGKTSAQPKPTTDDEVIMSVVKNLVGGVSGSSSSNSIMGAMLIQNLLENKTTPQQPPQTTPTTEEKQEKQKPPPRVRTPLEILWQEANGLGRKLDSLVNHAKCIKQQSEQDGDDWCWAASQMGPLSKELGDAKVATTMYDTSVRTSSLANLVKKNGDGSMAWLTKFNEQVEKSIANLELPLSILLGMHATMLKRRSSVQKPKAKAKAKAKIQEVATITS